MMDTIQFLEFIKTRRSVRKYLPDAVPEKDTDLMIEAASWAPSGTNTQNWHFIVIRSASVKEAMRSAVERTVTEYAGRIASPRGVREFMAYGQYYYFFTQAPVVIAVVKKPYQSLNLRIMERYGLGDGMYSSSDVQGPSAAVQNLILMAHALGYGSCWMTGPLIARKELEAILEIAAPDELMALIPVGQPEKTGKGPHRKKLNDIITNR
jgi:nitroreductase